MSTVGTTTDLELRRTAYHESGHALVAWLFGARIFSASIIPESDTWGRVRCRPPLGPIRRLALDVAGYVAEHRFCGRFESHESDPDMISVKEQLAELYPSGAPVDAIEFRRGIQLACNLIDRHRNIVRRVARRLLAAEELDGPAIARLFHGTQRLRGAPQ